MEYNAAASLYIRINIKLSISFLFIPGKHFLCSRMPCHTHAEVDFISVPVNTQTPVQTNTQLEGIRLQYNVNAKLQPQSFLIVVYSVYINIHNCNCISSQRSGLPIACGGGGYFMGPMFGPTSLHFCLLLNRKANVNNFSVSA